MQQKSMLDAMPSEQDLAFMLELIKVMRDAGVVNKSGGPFGAGDRVIQTTTPVPFRGACDSPGLPIPQQLGSQRLRDVFRRECCPMCCSTSYRANIRQVFDAAS